MESQVTHAPARANRTASESTIPCFDPATGEELGQVPVCPPERVGDRIRRARSAQAAWAAAPMSDRRKVLRHLLTHILEHADQLCDIIVRDSGKTRENAMMGEIWPVCEKLRYTIAHGEKFLRPERRSSGLLVHKKARVEYQPLGVIGVICPWNYPLQNVFGPTIAALMAGNAAVVKVSEWVAWSSTRIQQIFDEAFRAAGYSPDLVQIINGYGDTGAALVSGGVDEVIFTGSMANGRKVIAESAKNVTPVIAELGGKDAMIVCDDAELEQAAHSALSGAFIAAGQNCLAAERVLVFDEVYDEFVERLTELVGSLRQGASPRADGSARDPKETHADVGAMTTPAQLDIVEHLVTDAVSRGARLLAGGHRTKRGQGYYFEPTLLADVTPDMPIMQEETFGPVLAVCRVRDEQEAVRVTNETQYGLGLTVMTKSPKRAERIVGQVVTGGASVNEFGLPYMAQDLPFGGARGSGFGRLNGREGLRACTNVRAVLYDRFPIHVPTKLYPVGPWDYATTKSTLRMIYGPGMRARMGAAGELVSTLRNKLGTRS
jgi:acyl-CoA reductase-like NAD-dependent aldehyde dehydrogenase